DGIEREIGWILMPPFGGSSPPAPARHSGLYQLICEARSKRRGIAALRPIWLGLFRSVGGCTIGQDIILYDRKVIRTRPDAPPVISQGTSPARLTSTR